jgi:hypothetical protein
VAHVRPLPKKPDGSRRYQVRYLAPDGRERARNFARKADADRFAASVETDKARGEWIDPRLGKTTVEEWGRGVAPAARPRPAEDPGRVREPAPHLRASDLRHDPVLTA